MESDRPESRSMCTWPGLKISGVPLLRASSRGSPQKALSRVLDRRQARTHRLCQSTWRCLLFARDLDGVATA